MRRWVYVFLRGNRVCGDLEILSPSGEDIPAPVPPEGKTVLEVTANPAWTGLGSLNFHTYNGDGTFTAPVRVPELRVSRDRFQELFGMTLFSRIKRARNGDPLAVPPLPPDYQVDYFFDKLGLVPDCNLLSDNVTRGLNMLILKGLLTPDERDRIQRNELPAA